jgi:hypothetical protein
MHKPAPTSSPEASCVLGAGRDLGALVQEHVLEPQRATPAWADRDAVIEERGGAAGAAVVEVDQQRQQARLVGVADERAVVVRREPLTGRVAVAAEALVQADGPASAQPRGDVSRQPREQPRGEVGVVEHHPCVVADVGAHDRAAHGRYRCGRGAERLDPGDQRGALVGGREGVDHRGQRGAAVEAVAVDVGTREPGDEDLGLHRESVTRTRMRARPDVWPGAARATAVGSGWRSARRPARRAPAPRRSRSWRDRRRRVRRSPWVARAMAGRSRSRTRRPRGRRS